jgi:ribosome-associated translation inhibitor RaiA
MKITLNQIEINAAIELYVREKCVRVNGYGWEISEIKITLEDDNVTATVSAGSLDFMSAPPQPCAPACPPQPKSW